MAGLGDALKQGDKTLIGNKGFRRYVAARGERFTLDTEKVKAEARYDGLWVLVTKNGLSARASASRNRMRLSWLR